MAIPQNNNPITDQSGKNCAVNQNDTHVFFLAGTTGGSVQRVCIVPTDKAILIPILNHVCSFAEYPKYKTESELRNCAITGENGGTLEGTIDVQNILNLDGYRVQSQLFNVTFTDHNIFGTPSGKTQAVSDGWWVFLQPLATGKHEIDERIWLDFEHDFRILLAKCRIFDLETTSFAEKACLWICRTDNYAFVRIVSQFTADSYTKVVVLNDTIRSGFDINPRGQGAN